MTNYRTNYDMTIIEIIYKIICWSRLSFDIFIIFRDTREYRNRDLCAQAQACGCIFCQTSFRSNEAPRLWQGATKGTIRLFSK